MLAELEPEESHRQQQIRVLLVDDDPHVRELVKIYLHDARFQVTAVGSGEQALRLMQQRPFDVVLLDIMMPGMDGYQTAMCVKKEPELRHIPIIMFTSLVDNEAEDIRALAYRAGATEFLHKSIDRDSLIKSIETVLFS
jgi:CheY-like chemotaxis protein